MHEVMGWRLRRTGTALVARNRPADGYWYGNRPELLGDIRGPGVDAIIERIEAAVKDYPYPGPYHVWPGPNSNTFVAFVLRRVPELRVDLPPTAIGKDYLGWRSVATHSERHGWPGEPVRAGRCGRGNRGRPRGQSARAQFRRGPEEPVDQTTDRRAGWVRKNQPVPTVHRDPLTKKNKRARHCRDAPLVRRLRRAQPCAFSPLLSANSSSGDRMS